MRHDGQIPSSNNQIMTKITMTETQIHLSLLAQDREKERGFGY
jgi:hypothetical protein